MDKQFNEKKISLNTYDNLADEKIYKDILEKNTLNLEINSKFEEVVRNYKNNLSINNRPIKEVNFFNNISNKKKKFIETILPLAIDQNQKILIQRQQLIEIKNYLNINKSLTDKHQRLYAKLVSQYLIESKHRHKIDVIDDLLIRVDVIPNSIVLAQAANESGWGSSRFTKEYNALFGQYTYDSNAGVIPLRRNKGEKHLIKFFSSIDKSVESYFTNINTHYAYSEFRKFRKLLRDQDHLYNPPHTSLLVNKLNVYADDSNYINIINSIINVNKLTQYDNSDYDIHHIYHYIHHI